MAAYATLGGIDTDALALHIEAAVTAGATEDDIADVLEITSILGIHTAAMATPIVLEEMAALGLQPPDPHTPEVERVKADFVRRRGYWNPLWEAIASFSPQFLAAYLDFSAVPVERDRLDAPTRELIFIVANCVTTHLNPGGVRIHIRNALTMGVPAGAVMEVFQLVAPIGLTSVVLGFEVLDRRNEKLDAQSHS